MSTRDDYTVEEWELIRRAPAESVIAIEQASPSGFWGRRRERRAAVRSFADAIAQTTGLELCDAIVSARDGEGALLDTLRASGESFIERAVETARGARRAVAAKGTRPELEAYISAILAACEAVALASNEGDKGGKTSRAEALLLGRLAGALGRPTQEPPNSAWVGIPAWVEKGTIRDIVAGAPLTED